MENVVFEKNLASHPKENSLSVSHRAENPLFALSSTQRLASSVPGKLRFPFLHPLIFIELYLSIFPSPFFFLFFLFVLSAHLFYIDIFSRKDKIRARGYTTRFAIYISRFHHVENRVGGTEVSLVSPLLREKEFECISTFLRETCSICSSYFLTCSLAIFVQSFTACLQIVFLFLFCFCLNCRSCSFCELHIFIE